MGRLSLRRLVICNREYERNPYEALIERFVKET